MVSLNTFETFSSHKISSNVKVYHETEVKGVIIFELTLINEKRGNLLTFNFPDSLPFIPLRYFLITNVPKNEIRGNHAHKQCHLFFNCIKGSCKISVDNGKKRKEIILDSIKKGVYIPPMTWGMQYEYSPDAILLVLASNPYDCNDYISDYDTFLKLLMD